MQLPRHKQAEPTVSTNKGKKSVFSDLEETLAVRNYGVTGFCFNFT